MVGGGSSVAGAGLCMFSGEFGALDSVLGEPCDGFRRYVFVGQDPRGLARRRGFARLCLGCVKAPGISLHALKIKKIHNPF
jgi:hypothetical protein